MVSLLVNILTRTFKMQTFNNHYAGIFDKTGEIIYIYIYIYIHPVWREAGQFWGKETSKPNLSKAAFKGRKHGACHLPFPGILLAKNGRMR